MTHQATRFAYYLLFRKALLIDNSVQHRDIENALIVKQPKRYLNEYEEAIGVISAVSVYENSLIITMDSARIAVDFISIEELEKSKNLLGKHIGQKVAILRSDNSSKPFYIRLLKKQNQNMETRHK